MKLYGFPPSPNTRKLQALALELGIEIEFQLVDLAAGEQKRAQYLALSPAGRTPTLVDGDFVLTESNAIMQYLAEKTGDTPLWPRDAKWRALVNSWMCWQLDHWNRACNVLIFENLIKKIMRIGEPDSAEVKRGEALFATYATELDARLAKNEFIAGAQLTIADLSIAAPLEFTQPARMPVEPYANIRRWYTAIAARKSWRRTAPPPLPQ